MVWYFGCFLMAKRTCRNMYIQIRVDVNMCFCPYSNTGRDIEKERGGGEDRNGERKTERISLSGL